MSVSLKLREWLDRALGRMRPSAQVSDEVRRETAKLDEAIKQSRANMRRADDLLQVMEDTVRRMRHL